MFMAIQVVYKNRKSRVFVNMEFLYYMPPSRVLPPGAGSLNPAFGHKTAVNGCQVLV